MDYEDFKTPGQLIKALIVKRGWTQRLLAVILDIDETKLNKIIAGKAPVTAETALLLGEVFESQPEHFLDLQKKYDLAHARIIVQPDPLRSTRAHLFGGLPVTEMIKRGWLEAPNIKAVQKVESELARFFDVEKVEDIEILPHAAKKTDTFKPITPPQLAWFYRVRQIASEMIVPKYSELALRNALDSLKGLLTAPESARKVPRILMECGIRYVVVETLSSAKIDGVCFWLNHESPVIGMTLRYDRIDNFWFVLRHEIEHVRRGHGQRAIMLDAELDGDGTNGELSVIDEESSANEAAANFCVPQEKMEGFIARKSPFFNERDIIGFARTMHIHPGLIAGQLQRKTGKYNLFRKHLVNIRKHVIPNTLSDGWGNVIPVDM